MSKNKQRMKILSIYPYNDIYQVVSEDETIVYFQGKYIECEQYYNETFKDNESI